MFKLGFCDIECSDLDARWARLITFAHKPYGEEAKVIVNPSIFSKSNRASDKQMLINIRNIIEQYDIIVWYYGVGRNRFDVPMINGRLLSYNERPIQSRFHLDMYPVVRNNLRLKNNKLSDVASLLKIEGKDHVDPERWVKAIWDGDKKALEYIVKHNKTDVEILEAVFDRLKPFIQTIRRH